jgi:hypothetical protein
VIVNARNSCASILPLASSAASRWPPAGWHTLKLTRDELDRIRHGASERDASERDASERDGSEHDASERGASERGA